MVGEGKGGAVSLGLNKCPDRRYLAGRLGALLCTAFLEAEWVTRTPVHRAIRLTDVGGRDLHARRGLVDLPSWRGHIAWKGWRWGGRA
jgi:hypothetical protein